MIGSFAARADSRGDGYCTYGVEALRTAQGIGRRVNVFSTVPGLVLLEVIEQGLEIRFEAQETPGGVP